MEENEVSRCSYALPKLDIKELDHCLPEPVLVLGGGLLGGSLALALEQAGWPVCLGVRRKEVVEQWQQIHANSTVQVELEPQKWLAERGGIVVLAVPPKAMATVLANLLENTHLPQGVLVTDLGSVKNFVEQELLPICMQHKLGFVGSHPMAGSEKSGFVHARADLFVGSRCILCPTVPKEMPNIDLRRIRSMWHAVGCRIFEMNAKEHDQQIARVSHMVHFAAAALMQAAAEENEQALELTGSGLKDSSRVAAGSVPLWLEIAQTNKHAIAQSLKELQAKVTLFEQALEQEDWEKLEQLLRLSKKLRNQLDV